MGKRPFIQGGSQPISIEAVGNRRVFAAQKFPEGASRARFTKTFGLS